MADREHPVLTQAVLDAAVRRANETFDSKGHLHLSLKDGERMTTDVGLKGFAGLAGKNYAIAIADTNGNGKLDGNDTVVIAGGGYILTGNAKGQNVVLSEAPAEAKALIDGIRGGKASTNQLGTLVSNIAKNHAADSKGNGGRT